MPSANRMHLDPAYVGVVQSLLQAHVPANVEVYVFGSRATETFSSDLDLCLKGPVAIDADHMLAITAAFRDSDLPIKVDVVDWNTISEEFREAIAPDLQRIWP